MSDSQVIARRFRPQAYSQVIGQETITRTLINSIRSGRIHHAYLFTGARGVGKTTTARIFAKSLNCAEGVTTDPCGQCHSCQDIAASRSIDVLEIDAASNTGVENVRNAIINTVSISPARDRYKIFIIDEVHMLSLQAFNALLKTVEEPPPRVVFILATTELQKVPETILSRCQVFEFKTITLKKITEQLRSISDELGVAIPDSALMAIARAGEGSMRDAESALDQVISFAGNTITDEDVSVALGLVDIETLNTTIQAIAEHDSERVIQIVEEIVSRGYDLRNFCREMMTHIRALLVIKVAGFDPELVQLPQGEGERLSRLVNSFSEQDLVRFFSILTKTEQDIRVSSQPRFQLEIGLIKMIQAGRLYMLEDLIHQFEELQSRLPGGLAPIAPSSKSPAPPDRTSSLRPVAEKVRIPPPAKSVSTGEPVAETKPAIRDESPSSSQPIKAQPPEIKETPPVVYSAPQPDFSLPPEPPDFAERFDSASDLPLMKARPAPAANSTQSHADRIKGAIEAKGKRLFLSILDHAESIQIEGDSLRIRFPAGAVKFKKDVESKDNRKLLDEVCREVAGRALSLVVTVGAEAPSRTETMPKQQTAAVKPAVEEHSTVRAIADKFHGKIEIIKPDQ